jgi:amino-acid N-acetyltransferase
VVFIVKFFFASVEDEEQIKQILAASGLHYQDIRPSQLQHFLIVKDDTASTLSGVVGLEQKGDVGLLRSLAVAKAYRRQGLAIQLVGKIEEYARSQKVAALYLLTMTAEDFFSARGYQKTDRESAPPVLQETTEFKSLCPETAVCMKKHL